MPIGKSLRFDIFARDSFTCQYCGKRPPDTVLEVDHIHPVSKGGSDEILNLITACYDCNRGKRAKIISEVAPRPDADVQFLKAQQEIVEAKRYLAAKKKLDKANLMLCKYLQETWSTYLTENRIPKDKVILIWLKKYSPSEIETSIKAAIPFYSRHSYWTEEKAVNDLINYVGAVLRNRKEEANG